jgi:hypothetical protein
MMGAKKRVIEKYIIDCFLAERMDVSAPFKLLSELDSTSSHFPMSYAMFLKLITNWLGNSSVLWLKLHGQYNVGNLYILMGISSVGKTTLLKKVHEQCPNIIAIEGDEFGGQLNMSFLRKIAPSVFDVLYYRFGFDLLHYVFCDKNQDPFWLKLSQNERTYYQLYTSQLRQNIIKNEREMVSLLPDALLAMLFRYQYSGFKVLLDMNINEQELGLLRFLKPKLITVYMGLADLAQAVESRNEKALSNNRASDWRHPLIVYRQYSDSYVGAIKNTNVASLGDVSDKDVMLVVNKAVEQYSYNLPRAYQTKKQFKELLRTNLHLKKHSFSEVYPKFWCSGSRVVNMSACSLDEAENQVIKMIK